MHISTSRLAWHLQRGLLLQSITLAQRTLQFHHFLLYGHKPF